VSAEMGRLQVLNFQRSFGPLCERCPPQPQDTDERLLI
jgi:hypothetical protein